MPLNVKALLFFDELDFAIDQSGIAVPGATKGMNTRQSEAITRLPIFSPLHPLTIKHTTRIHYPQFLSHQETKLPACQSQQSVSTISLKRGL